MTEFNVSSYAYIIDFSNCNAIIFSNVDFKTECLSLVDKIGLVATKNVLEERLDYKVTACVDHNIPNYRDIVRICMELIWKELKSYVLLDKEKSYYLNTLVVNNCLHLKLIVK